MRNERMNKEKQTGMRNSFFAVTYWLADELTDKQTDGQTGGWTYRRVDGRADRRMSRHNRLNLKSYLGLWHILIPNYLWVWHILKQIFETENFKRASDGNYYQSLTQQAITWESARADCKGTESGARLAMLSNEISFQAVLQLIRDDHGWIDLIDWLIDCNWRITPQLML